MSQPLHCLHCAHGLKRPMRLLRDVRTACTALACALGQALLQADEAQPERRAHSHNVAESLEASVRGVRYRRSKLVWVRRQGRGHCNLPDGHAAAGHALNVGALHPEQPSVNRKACLS